MFTELYKQDTYCVILTGYLLCYIDGDTYCVILTGHLLCYIYRTLTELY